MAGRNRAPEALPAQSSGFYPVPEAEELATPGATVRLLRAFHVRPRKRWGQHFLVSRRALDQILAAADLGRGDTVLDIGAGLGTLTAALAARAGTVIAVEIDSVLLPALRAVVGSYTNVTIVQADIMHEDPSAFFHAPGPRKVVANLPYYLASPLIVSLLERSLGLSHLVVTVQREVADRLTASPANRDYGALSVAVQYRATASVVSRLPRTAFYPAPEVESAIVLLQVREHPAVTVDDEAAFFRVVRASFSQRRKTLRNALASALRLVPGEVETLCWEAGIDPHRRGETLTLDEFAALTRAVHGASQRRSPSGGKGVVDDRSMG